MTAEQSGEVIEIPVVWVGADDDAIVAVNQFALTDHYQFEESVLTLGHLAPPLFTGSPDQQLAHARDIESVPIRTIVRVSMSRVVARQLRDAFVQHINHIEERASG